MADIELACHTSAWQNSGMINALSDIERAGFRGVEMTSEVVEQFEDRVNVFKEILIQHRMNLIAITYGGKKWPGMNLDEEVERGVNIARFLRTSGANLLTIVPPFPDPDNPIEDEMDLLPAATAFGEIARRTLELEVQTCLMPRVETLVSDLRLLEEFVKMADPEALKLCLDVGFLNDLGVDARNFIESHKSKIGMVRLKDYKTKKSGEKGGLVELGKGSLDLEGFVEALLDTDYTGWATVEIEPQKSKSNFQIIQACHKYAEQSLDLVL